MTLAGNIGYAVLADEVVAIDYRRGRVYPLPAWSDDLDFGPDVAGPFGAQAFRVELGHVLVSAARFEALAEEVPVILDTGTNSAVIGRSLATRLGIGTDGRRVLVGSSAVAGGRTVDTEIVRLRSCAVAGQSARHTWAAIVPDAALGGLAPGLGAQAILGGTFFREHLVAFDYPAGQIRLAPYTSQDHLFDQFRAVGIELSLEGGSYHVFTVFHGSDALAKGVVPGERLRALDGEPVDPLPLATVLERLRGEPGTSATLTLEGQAGTRTVEVLREDLLPEL